MKKVLITLAAFSPLLALAQPQNAGKPDLGYISSLVNSLGDILNLLLPIVVTLALLFFFWGLALFILNADNEEARGKGRSIMVWGIVALFVIVAVWGLVGLLAQIFGVETGKSAPVPGVGTLDTDPLRNN